MFTSDKVGHGYLPTYLYLASLIGTTGQVCEVGVASGESLTMWQHLFPHGRVVGVDVNPGAIWPDGTDKVVANQADPNLPNLLPAKQFDLIVDDASHNNALTDLTWQILWPLVVPGGWYVIEDWSHAGGLVRCFAGDLLDCFRERDPLTVNVEEITYRPGLIIMKRGPA